MASSGNDQNCDVRYEASNHLLNKPNSGTRCPRCCALAPREESTSCLFLMPTLAHRPKSTEPYQSSASAAWAHHARTVSSSTALSGDNQSTTSETLPTLRTGNEHIWSKLGFTSPDVLAFHQEAPSRSDSKISKFLDDLKDMIGQSDTVNDRLKKAVESKLTQDERSELAKARKRNFTRSKCRVSAPVWAGAWKGRTWLTIL